MTNEQVLLGVLQTEVFLSKGQLRMITGFCDRTLRKTVENLRRDGYLILASDDNETNGYKIAVTDEEIKKLKQLYRSRQKTMFETDAALFGAIDTLQQINRIRKNILEIYSEEVNKALRNKDCVGCNMCHEHFNGVCVYDIEV